MAKGYQQDRARKDQVSALGKTLVRRSGKKCELCGVSGESMAVMEVEPAPEQPDPDHAVLICEPCGSGASGGKLSLDRWRFLDTAIWSEVPAVQVTAVRLCRRLEREGADWAGSLLSDVYLTPEVEAWIDKTS